MTDSQYLNPYEELTTERLIESLEARDTGFDREVAKRLRDVMAIEQCGEVPVAEYSDASAGRIFKAMLKLRHRESTNSAELVSMLATAQVMALVFMAANQERGVTQIVRNVTIGGVDTGDWQIRVSRPLLSIVEAQREMAETIREVDSYRDRPARSDQIGSDEANPS